MDNLSEKLRQAIVNVPDFPKKGILFRDVTPILLEPDLFKKLILKLSDIYKDKGITAIVGVESRGFWFGVPLALSLNVPFVPLRKPGKLPREAYRQKYRLEYGESELQMHKGVLGGNDRVVIVDDLLATGGTACASIKLVEQSGATVYELAFMVELTELSGRKVISKPIFSLVEFQGL